MVIKLKPWLITQLGMILPFIKEHTARRNGQNDEVFSAKAGSGDDNVIITKQLKDSALTQAETDLIWDNS